MCYVAMSSSLVIGHNPSDPDYDEYESQLITIIQDLVDGSVDCASAAQTVDKIVVDECQEAFVSHTSAPSPTPEQLADGTIRGPQPAGWQRFLWDILGSAAMRVPAEDAGQDRLVGLVQELRRLPRHSAPWLASGPGSPREMELWRLSRENGYACFEQWLWELHEGHFAGLGSPGAGRRPGAAAAYLNFSAFLARLLAAHVVDATRLCALVIRPSPFARSPAISARYEPYSDAATQWIRYAGEALYEMCEKGVIAEIGSPRWTRARWDTWKAKFAVVAEDDEFTRDGRERARMALDRMAQIETKGIVGIGGSVVENLGFIIPEEEE